MKQTASVKKSNQTKTDPEPVGQFVTLNVLLLQKNIKTQISPNFAKNFQDLLKQNK